MKIRFLIYLLVDQNSISRQSDRILVCDWSGGWLSRSSSKIGLRLWKQRGKPREALQVAWQVVQELCEVRHLIPGRSGQAVRDLVAPATKPRQR